MQTRLKLVLIVMLVGMGGCRSDNNRAVLDSYPGFSCLSPNTIKYQAWGENGLSKACVNAQGINDGQFWVAETGRFFLRGSYENGEESGVWEFIDKNGAVTKKEMTK